MNYYIFVLGCQQNYYDAEKIAHLLEQMGFLESCEKNADLIIVLACSVRQKPLDRIFGKIKVWKNLPQKPKIFITACVLPDDKKKLENKVDAIVDSKDILEKLPKILKSNLKIENLPAGRQGSKLKINKNSIFVPIMFGCNNFCSYCAVPYTRGREISRSVDEIINEIKNLVKNGIDEITLLGQNVNSYKGLNKPGEKYTFAELLNELDKIEGLKKVSFLTAHPKDMSNGLIEWMGKSKKFSGELHLPVQSGDNEILRKMNRKYTSKHYLHLIENYKLKIKNLRLSTDVIVGFPSETKEQFNNTVELCKKINFAQAFVSQFSSRAGTPAAKMKDDVLRIEKKRRWKILNDLINRKKK